MKKLLEILRLHYDSKLSQRQIAKITNVARSTVGDYLSKFVASGLSWPLSEEFRSEDKLSERLKPNYVSNLNAKTSKLNFVAISQELRRHKNLTLQLIHEEHTELGGMPYSYSNFTLLYRKWLERQPNYMRQQHKVGEKAFVDYSGDRVTIIDTDTGKLRSAEIFVGVLGASDYIYLEATWTQTLADWTMSHVRMFEHFGGSPQLVINDNLRSGVTKAHRYDPDITPAYFHMLAHYGVAAMPARPNKPKDKPKVENSVLIMQRWALARLRHEQIYGLAALNSRLHAMMEIANAKKFRRYPENRQELFLELDKPYLRPLPQQRFVYREYKKIRVSRDYHINLLQHHYSVPYTLINQEIDVWYTAGIVECYHKNLCVAKHIRSTNPRGITTRSEHMPRAHQEYAGLTVDKMREWAKSIGTATYTMVDTIIKESPHNEIGSRRSHGFLNLSKKYSPEQLEAACLDARLRGVSKYEYIEVIIKNKLADLLVAPTSVIPIHDNIRGSGQYH